MIGQGSYGAVYQAIDKRDKSEVAVKIISVSKDITPLKKEIDILKECHSSFVTQYKGCWKKGKVMYIVMEYCSAGSVCDLMSISQQSLTDDEIAAVCKQVLYGLQYLHSQKMIHRDIKCGNILLTTQGDAKLADFGVSAQLENTIDKRSTLIGTPYWMAPEVLRESTYDGKADIWSLGITAIEMAMGAPPHADVHPMRAIFLIPNSPPPSLPLDEYFSPEFRSFISTCCVKDHTKRPTAKELLEKHPFITSAGGKEVITALVKESIDKIKESRKLRKEEASKKLEEDLKRIHIQQSSSSIEEDEIPVWDMEGTMLAADKDGKMVDFHKKEKLSDDLDQFSFDNGTIKRKYSREYL